MVEVEITIAALDIVLLAVAVEIILEAATVVAAKTTILVL